MNQELEKRIQAALKTMLGDAAFNAAVASAEAVYWRERATELEAQLKSAQAASQPPKEPS